jgi:[ribosomal protein S18]-alanine N-acetyltransferase
MTGEDQPVAATDANVLAALHASAFDQPWNVREIESLLEGPGAFALALADGFILVRALAGESEIITLAVRPEARRRGVARRLIDAAAVQAIGAGADEMFLEVAEDNPAALGLYHAAGFQPVGRRRGYYARTGGAGPVDALVMRLTLNR